MLDLHFQVICDRIHTQEAVTWADELCLVGTDVQLFPACEEIVEGIELRLLAAGQVNVILADIFDVLAQINANLIAIGSHKSAKQPKPYPRPVQKDPENVRHFGRGALPPDELRAWFEKKREERKCQ